MSHRPPREYQPLGYSQLPTSTLGQPHRQSVMNQQAFQQAMTGASPASMPAAHSANSSQPTVVTVASNSTSTAVSHSPSGSIQNNQCDNCHALHSVQYQNERGLKYNLCDTCRSQELTKRKSQMDRYDMYDEQQNSYKHPRTTSLITTYRFSLTLVFSQQDNVTSKSSFYTFCYSYVVAS
ncbi:hypothetical protein BDF14DRAFT_1998088 [Spinellus fusiger]|nr:hypothetical protein BDF14DRAFT_1998088 [Spinellus fusiger]